MENNLFFKKRLCFFSFSRWRYLPLTFLIFLFWQPGVAQVLNESFDDSSLPVGWTQAHESGSSNWATVSANGNSTIYPRTGVRMAEFRNTSSGSSTKLITPSLDLTGLSNPLLTFYYANVNWAGDIDELRVYYKTSASGNWIQIGDDYVDEKTAWQKVELILPDPTADYYVAFEATSNWARGLDLDDVSIDEAPSCITPTGLTVSNITTGSADLSWASTGDTFDISWGEGSFEADNGTIIGFTNGGTLSGLSANTAYQYYVRQDCGGGDLSNWAGPYSFFTGYCVPTGTSSLYRITGVTTEGGYLNVSNSGNGTSNPYSDYTDKVVSQSPGENITYTVNISSGVGIKIWIDYNQNLVFDDDELVASHTTYNSSGFWTGTISVPGDQAFGNYRMRIRSNYYSYTIPTCGDAQYGYGEAEDYTLSVEAPPSCLPPSGLTADNITAGSADLSWTSDGDTFDISWDEGAFDAEDGNIENGFTNGGTLSGLSANTAYQYYVRQDCGGGDTSSWAGPFGFTTACAAVAGFNENFDGGGTGTSTDPNLPNCWSFIDSGSGYGYVYNSSSPHSAPNHFFLSNSFDASGDYILVSPETENLGNGENWVRFYAKGLSGYTLQVGTLSNPADAGTFTPLETIYLTGTYTEYTVVLPAGTDDYIGFRHGLGDTYRSVYIDDIVYEEAPSCITPTGVTLENVDGHTADFSWGAIDNAEGYNWSVFADGDDPETATAVASGNVTEASVTVPGLDPETAYDFYVQTNCGAEDGESELSAKVDFTTTVACPAPTGLTASNITSQSADLSWTSDGDTFDISWGEGTFDAEDGTIQSFANGGTLSGLSESTTYRYYVRQDCDDDGTSIWAGPFSFSTSCEPGSIPFFEGFESGFDDGVAVGGCWSQESVTGTNAWSANSSETLYNRAPRTGSWNAFLKYGSENWLFYPVELEGGVSYTLEFYARQDGTGASNASVKASYGSSNNAAAMTNTIISSTGIINGDYQLVSGIFTPETSGTYYIGINGTINYSPWYISIDDISIDLAPSCLAPTGVTLENVDGHTADFSWSEIDNAEGYNWLVFADGDDPETATAVASGNVTEASVTVPGLDPETAYDFYVQTNCGTEDGESELSAKVDFTTTVACPAPTDLSHTQLSMTSAELSWTSSGSSFELKWGEAGFDPETDGTLVDELTGTSYTLEGLTTDANYAFYVRSNCDTDGFSTWAGPYSFSVGYCSPSTSDVTFEFITNVSFAEIDNTTIGITGLNNYTDQIANVQAGSTETISVSIDTDANDYLAVFIDWNQNGILDDDGEAYILAGNVGNDDVETFVSDIPIPFDAETGSTRMRVVQRWNATPTPCDSYTYGEIEDYTVNVSGPVTWTGTEWINGSPGDDVSVLVNGALSIANDAPGLEVNDMFVSENGSVTVESGNTLTINGKITNNAVAAAFTVENNGNLIQNGTAANTGNITVKRNSNPMIRLDYTMWSSPVIGQNLFGFSPETVNGVTNYEGSEGRIYVYDGTNGYVHPDSFTESSVMNSATGYLFRAPNNWSATEEAAYEGVFTGVPINGDVTVNTVANSYTSIGNPYPSNISINSLVNANTGITTLYFWNNNHSAGNNYATCTNSGGCVAANGGGDTPNGTIAVGQGFIVSTSGSSVSFSNDMRVDDSGSFFKVDELESHRIWLNLNGENEEKYNQIMVGYIAEATNGVDNQIDGEMFGYQGSALYNLIDQQNFVIQGRALPFEVSDVVPLGFRAVEYGKFTVSLANLDGLFTEGNITVYLKDKQLDIIHNLMESDYNFESAAGEFNDRFEIVYGDDGTMGTSDWASNNVQIYQHDQNIIMESKSEKILSVELFDLQGRNIFRNEKVNANVYQIKSASFGTQVLVVRVQTHEGVIVTKKVINN